MISTKNGLNKPRAHAPAAILCVRGCRIPGVHDSSGRTPPDTTLSFLWRRIRVEIPVTGELDGFGPFPIPLLAGSVGVLRQGKVVPSAS